MQTRDKLTLLQSYNSRSEDRTNGHLCDDIAEYNYQPKLSSLVANLASYHMTKDAQTQSALQHLTNPASQISPYILHASSVFSLRRWYGAMKRMGILIGIGRVDPSTKRYTSEPSRMIIKNACPKRRSLLGFRALVLYPMIAVL